MAVSFCFGYDQFYRAHFLNVLFLHSTCFWVSLNFILETGAVSMGKNKQTSFLFKLKIKILLSGMSSRCLITAVSVLLIFPLKIPLLV